MSTAELKRRVDRVEKASRPTVEEALGWMDENNRVASEVLREAFNRLGGHDKMTNFPPEPETIEEWLEMNEKIDKAAGPQKNGESQGCQPQRAR